MAVLGLLHESPLHGYELRKRLNLLLGWTRLLSYGSLYPALKRMLREGVDHRGDHPGTVSMRQRITYQITPAGREMFAHEVTDDGPNAWEDESFNMRFAFFSRTSADVRLRILEGAVRVCRNASTAASHRGWRRPLPQRAAPPLDRVGRARSALAHRPHQRRAPQRHHQGPAGHTTRSAPAPTPVAERLARSQEGTPTWDPFE